MLFWVCFCTFGGCFCFSRVSANFLGFFFFFSVLLDLFFALSQAKPGIPALTTTTFPLAQSAFFSRAARRAAWSCAKPTEERGPKRANAARPLVPGCISRCGRPGAWRGNGTGGHRTHGGGQRSGRCSSSERRDGVYSSRVRETMWHPCLPWRGDVNHTATFPYHYLSFYLHRSPSYLR